MVMDATSGSRLTFSPLDVNGDEEFSEADFVQVTIDGEEKKVPVTGRESKGISSAPVIVAGDESSDRILEGNTAPPFRNISLLNPGNEDRGRQTWRLLQLQ
jgi:type IV pilus assembly protein PilY1